MPADLAPQCHYLTVLCTWNVSKSHHKGLLHHEVCICFLEACISFFLEAYIYFIKVMQEQYLFFENEKLCCIDFMSLWHSSLSPYPSGSLQVKAVLNGQSGGSHQQCIFRKCAAGSGHCKHSSHYLLQEGQLQKEIGFRCGTLGVRRVE